MIELTSQERRKIEKYAEFYATKLIEMECDYQRLQAEWAEIQEMLLGKTDGNGKWLKKIKDGQI